MGAFLMHFFIYRIGGVMQKLEKLKSIKTGHKKRENDG